MDWEKTGKTLELILNLRKRNRLLTESSTKTARPRGLRSGKSSNSSGKSFKKQRLKLSRLTSSERTG